MAFQDRRVRFNVSATFVKLPPTMAHDCLVSSVVSAFGQS